MIPHLRFYTDRLPDGVAGRANAFVVRIRPAYKDDIGLLMHELEHVKQSWRGWIVGHGFLYTFSRNYRLWSEVQAYKVQMQYGLALDKAAEQLVLPRYKLGIGIEQARLLLF